MRRGNSLIQTLPGYASEEERNAAIRAIRANGDKPNEIAEFAARNYGLGMRIARKMMAAYPNANLEDLQQEGFLGLVKAAKAFDPDHGVTFSTYADRAIRQQLTRALQQRMFDRPFALSHKIEEDLHKWRRMVAEFTKVNNRLPLQHEIREMFLQIVRSRSERKERPDVSSHNQSAADHMHQLTISWVNSLEAPVNDGAKQTLHDVIGSEDFSPGHSAELEQMCLLAPTIIRKVDAYVKLRCARGDFPLWWEEAYWLMFEEEATLESVAQQLGYTREAVRQARKAISRRVQLRLGYTDAVVRAAYEVFVQMRVENVCEP